MSELRKRFSRVCLWVLVAACVMSAAPAGAQEESAPPPLDIPTTALTGGALGPQYVDMIRTRLAYWRDQIVNATAAQTVIDARTGIVSDYKRLEVAGYTVAQLANEVLTPALTGLQMDDKLLALKQVNLALALSQMPRVTIQPALQAMVAHPNEAVRYLAWQGYRAARTKLLAQTSEVIRRFFASMQTTAQGEDSAAVLSAMFEAANITSFGAGGSTIVESTLQDAQRQALSILQANWRRWCERAVGGDIEMMRAMLKGVAAVQSLVNSADDAGKTAAVQMLVDAMRACSLAYDEAGADGPVAEEAEGVLRVCESALAAEDGAFYAHTKKRGDYVTEALGERDAELRQVNVPTAVLKWIEELTDFGVTKTEFDSAAPAPTPSPVPSADDAEAAG